MILIDTIHYIISYLTFDFVNSDESSKEFFFFYFIVLFFNKFNVIRCTYYYVCEGYYIVQLLYPNNPGFKWGVLDLRYKREVINPKLLTHYVTMFYYSNIPLFTMFYFWKHMYKIYLYAFTFTL